jgi:hypothetical protein
MKGRLFKLNKHYIDTDLDDFIFNTVLNRQNNIMHITKGKLAINSMIVDDYIFIQMDGIITHYMFCAINGPVYNNLLNTYDISIKNPVKLNNPIKCSNHTTSNGCLSNTKGHSFSILTNENIEFILNHQRNIIID